LFSPLARDDDSQSLPPRLLLGGCCIAEKKPRFRLKCDLLLVKTTLLLYIVK
jgi:hypothetical protein